MGNLSKLIVTLGLNAADYKAGLADADRETGSKVTSIGGKLEGLGKKMSSLGAGLTAGVTLPIAGMGLAAIDAASDLEESMSKVNVVFGDSAEGVIWFSETAAESLGQSQQQALEAAGTFGNLFVSMGMGQDTAAGMSRTMVRLASDLASFNNADPTEALDALRAGLTGETEPLKRFGINMNAAAVATKALELGLVETEVDMMKVQKATLDLEAAEAKLASMTQGASSDSVEYKKAKLAVAEAQQQLNKVLAAGTVDELAVREATIKVTEAQERHAAALEKYGEGSTQAQKAALALEKAQIQLNQETSGGTVDSVAYQKAVLKLNEAKAELKSITEGVSTESMEYREQVLKVEQAQADLDEALGGTVSEMTAAQKAQATYALIMDQTTLAQEDFTRTSDGLANSTRIAKAKLADVAATMGAQLLPIGLKVVTFVSDLLDKFTNLDPKAQTIILAIAGLAAVLGPVLSIAGPLVTGIGAITGALTAGAAAGTSFSASIWPITAIVAAIVGAVILFKKAWDSNFLGIRDALTDLWENTLKPIFTMLWEWLKEHIPIAIERLKSFWDNVLMPALRRVWSWIDTNLMPLFKALWELLKVALAKALEALRGYWENVLLPGIKMVWQFIEEKVMPIFKAVIGIIKERLGPTFQWLKTHVIDPVAAAFGSIGDIIQGIIGFIEGLIEEIQNLELPWWLQPGSPTPFELGLWGIQRALRSVARNGLPELEIALQGVTRVGDPVGAGMGAGAVPIQGDHYEIHNHGAAAAALTMATIEERRRARLNLSMG